MKKLGLFITTVVSFIGLGFILASCGGGLGSKYEKVEFALNGVEKSIKENSNKSSKSSDKLSSIDLNLGIINNNSIYNDFNNNMYSIVKDESAFDAIDRLYTSSDNQGDVIDELEYDQPPMIQFQYLKSALEKIGTGFEFGTKYYYDIQNTVYYDIDSGEIINDENHKWNYVFRLALEINIDDNDLITADISFDIKLTQNNIEHNQVWYVGMELDYDMNNTTPNYTLDMITNNQNLNNLYVIENDYVNVVDNKIDEWRKFLLETNEKVVKDTNHPNFDSYISEGIEYVVDHAKWYKNKNLRKLMNNTGENKRIVANAYFDSGMNTTDINSDAFLNKTGTSNEKIGEFYTEISNIYGKDIIYSILPSEEEHGSDSGGEAGGNDITGIAIKLDKDTDFGDDNYIVKNVKIGELFTDQQAWKNYDKSAFITPKLYGTDNNIAGEEITDVNYLDYYFVVNNQENRVEKSEYIVDALSRLNNPSTITIKVKLGNFSCTFGSSVRIDPDIINNDSSEQYIAEMLDLGFMDFRKNLDSNYEIEKHGNEEYVVTGLDFYDYKTQVLDYNSYVVINSDGYTLGKENGNYFYQVRYNGNNKTEFKIMDNPYVDGWDSANLSDLFEDKLIINGPNSNTAKFMIDTDSNKISIFGLSDIDREQYLNKLVALNNNSDTAAVIVGGNGFKEVIRVISKIDNTYLEFEIGEEEYNILRICYEPDTFTRKKVYYSVNGGTNQEFRYTNYGEFDQYSSSYYLYYYDYVLLKQNDVLTYTGSGFTISKLEITNSDSYGTMNSTSLTINDSYSNIYKITYFDRYDYNTDTEIQGSILVECSIESGFFQLNNQGGAWTSDDIDEITNILNNLFRTIEINQDTSFTIDNPVVIYSGNESNITCNITYASKNNPKDIDNMIIDALRAEGYEVAF